MPALSSAYDDLITFYSNAYGVPFPWVKGVIGAESDFNPNARGSSGEYGLMQLMPDTARAVGYSGDDSGLLDPETNIQIGTLFLADLMAQYGNDFSAVYSAYNSGSATKYRTSSQVQSNVTRAWSYVDAVVNALQSGAETAGAYVEANYSTFLLLAGAFALVYLASGRAGNPGRRGHPQYA